MRSNMLIRRATLPPALTRNLVAAVNWASAAARHRVLKPIDQLLRAQESTQPCPPPIPIDRSPSNGGSCPYPIPWLDKNGNHNQRPMPDVELSNISMENYGPVMVRESAATIT